MILVYLAIIILSVTQSASTKLFNRRSSNSTVFNATKAMSSFVIFAFMAAFGFTLHLSTVIFGIAYGICMCLSMYSGYKALCLGPMALTSMLVSFSIIIPLIWGLTVGNESLNLIRSVALLLLLAAIILTNSDKIFKKRTVNNEDGNPSRKSSYGLWLFFVFSTFLCNGISSILQKQHQALYPQSYNNEFMFFAMLFCTVVFTAILFIRSKPSDIKATKGKWLGALSGISNGLASFFTLILAGFENASILFPIITAGRLLGVLLCGKLLFKEKLRINHYFALGCGIIAVVFLKL